MFKVESGVPTPPASGRKNKYPWAGMNVGDSFFVPDAPASTRSAASIRGKTHGEMYVTRSENGGVRVWRVK